MCKILTEKLTQWAEKTINNIMDRIILITTKRKISKRKMIAQKINGKYTRASTLKITIKTIAYPVLAMMANQKNTRMIAQQRRAEFDTNSKSIGVDNWCSTCISNNIDDFIGNITESKQTINGFVGTRISNIMTGTILWKWVDNDGRIHQFKIPNSYYVTMGEMILLSPKHWAKTQIRQNRSNPKGI